MEEIKEFMESSKVVTYKMQIFHTVSVIADSDIDKSVQEYFRKFKEK
jgi:hypothetical protein